MEMGSLVKNQVPIVVVVVVVAVAAAVAVVVVAVVEVVVVVVAADVVPENFKIRSYETHYFKPPGGIYLHRNCRFFTFFVFV